MRLVIGGYAQGKLEYVTGNLQEGSYLLFKGGMPEVVADEQIVVLDQFHLFVRECLEKGINPKEKVVEFINKHPKTVIICDEIGNGIVPLDPFEREYRETTGRLLVGLAEMADEVVRVLCGIGQKIK